MYFIYICFFFLFLFHEAADVARLPLQSVKLVKKKETSGQSGIKFTEIARYRKTPQRPQRCTEDSALSSVTLCGPSGISCNWHMTVLTQNNQSPIFFAMAAGTASLCTRMFMVLYFAKAFETYQMPLYFPLKPHEFFMI